MEFITQLPPCLVGIEACKTDRNDVEAMAEAVTWPNMWFVVIKTTEQQDALLIHRARELVMRQRTAQVNQI